MFAFFKLGCNVQVCGMYEDYLEQLFFAPVKYFKDTVMAKWKGRQVPVVNDMIRVRFFCFTKEHDCKRV